MLHRKLRVWVLIGMVCLGLPQTGSAQTCPVPLSAADLVLIPSAPLVGQTARIYVTVLPNCTEDLEGSIQFSVDGHDLGIEPFSYKGNGSPEEVWTSWIPPAAGDYTIQVNVIGGGSASLTASVDRDTDSDGIGDQADTDDDNDGVPDSTDQFPLDASRSKDTDGDGAEDAVDSDDDNDGVYDFKENEQKTDPLKKDTDQDGVNDKLDAFPLDSKRSEEPEEAIAEDPEEPTQLQALPRAQTANAQPSSTSTLSATGTTTVLAGETYVQFGSDQPVIAPTATTSATTTPATSESHPILWGLAGLTTLFSIFFFWKSRRERE